jgi:hypothetical protein
MVIAEMGPADMPVKILGLEIERKLSARIALSAADMSLTASGDKSVGVSSGGLARG